MASIFNELHTLFFFLNGSALNCSKDCFFLRLTPDQVTVVSDLVCSLCFEITIVIEIILYIVDPFFVCIILLFPLAYFFVRRIEF